MLSFLDVITGSKIEIRRKVGRTVRAKLERRKEGPRE
jgi:hypothetical protein